MAMDFPASPTLGQIYQPSSGPAYKWDGSLWVPVVPTLAPPLAGQISYRNKVINGSFDLWERGTTPTSAGFLADRWAFNNSNLTASQSRIVIGPTTGVLQQANAAMYVDCTAVNNASHGLNHLQNIESVRTLEGRRVVVSGLFYSTAGKMGIRLIQNFGTGGSPYTTTEKLFTLTPSVWEYKEIVLDLPSIAGKTVNNSDGTLQLVLDYVASGAGYGGQLANLTGQFAATMVQLEEGSVATPFEWRPHEALLAGRYFRVLYDVVGTLIGAGENQKTIHFPPMRRAPTITIVSGAWGASFVALGNSSIRASASASQFAGCIIHADAEF